MFLILKNSHHLAADFKNTSMPMSKSLKHQEKALVCERNRIWKRIHRNSEKCLLNYLFLFRGTFIYEYVGEILNQNQFAERTELYGEQGQRHYYFMTLQSEQIIDATRKGNLSRFMNHSCNPNCATQKWIVQGRLRIGLFALRKIKAGTELTFDYKFIRFGAKAQRCLCGETNCKGVIGEEQREARILTKATAQEEDDSKSAIARFSGETGITDVEDLTLLARVMLRAEERTDVLPLLLTLRLTEGAPLRRFVSLHGVQIVSLLMGLHWRDAGVLEAAIKVLLILPIPNRNLIEDANVEEKLGRLSGREDLSEALREDCRELLGRWSKLEKIFRIPKVAPVVKSSVTTNEVSKVEVGKPESTKSGGQIDGAAAGYTLKGDEAFVKRSKWTFTDGSVQGQSQSQIQSQIQSHPSHHGDRHEICHTESRKRNASPSSPGRSRKVIFHEKSDALVIPGNCHLKRRNCPLLRRRTRLFLKR